MQEMMVSYVVTPLTKKFCDAEFDNQPFILKGIPRGKR